MDSDHNPPLPPPLTALSMKRGPTSWPNSPVKRNASLFSSASFSSTFASESGERKTLRNSVSMCIPPPPPPPGAAEHHPAKPTDSGTSSLLPPPPPFMTRSDNDKIDQDKAMREMSKSSGILSPFLLFDKRRPDSPMPPIFRSLPPSPQALSMSTQDFSSRHNQQDARSVAPFVGGGLAPLPTSKEGGYSPLSSYRGKASQSAEDLLALASSGPISNPVRTHYTAPSPLPKSRSQVNFGSSPTNTTSPRNVRSRTYHGRVL